MIRKHITIPIYQLTFILIIYWDENELRNKILKGADFDRPMEEFDGGVFDFEEKVYLSLKAYKEGGKKYPKNSVIAHEALHMVNRVMDYICHKPDRDNDEPDAYLLLWIIDEIEKFIDANESKIQYGS
ncbi:hypothetical protein [Ekhidna sp.]